MTIYINGRFLTQNRSGMQRWAEEVVAAWDSLRASQPESAAGRAVMLLPSPPRRELKLKTIETRVVRGLKGHAWEQWTLYWASRKGVLLNLLSSGPLLHGAMISTFHDAAVFRRPRLFSRSYRTLHRILRPLLARRSRALITVSKFSAGELSECLGQPRDRFVIVPNAAGHIVSTPPDPGILPKNGLEPRQYVLCVGNQTANKNISTAIAAFLGMERPGTKLVVVGAGDRRVFTGGGFPDHPAIVPLGYVSDGELRALYESAELFCFPSRYEGFGIPVLEAMALSCPVVASDAGAIPETAGDAAILCHPDDVNAFAQAMASVLDDPQVADAMRRRGRARAEAFSWEASAGVLSDLLSGFAEEARR